MKTCNSNCGFSNKCRRIRNCACRGSELRIISPEIEAAWIKACNDDHGHDSTDGVIITPTEWMCQNFDAELIFDKYNLVTCGLNPEETAKAKRDKADLTQQAEQKDFQKSAIVAVLGVVLTIVLLNSKLKLMVPVVLLATGYGAWSLLPKDADEGESEVDDDLKDGGTLPETVSTINEN